MKKQVTLLLATVVAVSLLFQGCATILGGSKDASRVHNGTPPGAKVYYNGNYVGDAPTNVKVPKNAKQGNSKIEIKADGYETATVNMTRKVSVGYTILDICTGVIWLGIDFATGNIYKPRPNKIVYNLTPISGYNPAKTYDFKNGDKVIFTKDKYENVDGVQRRDNLRADRRIDLRAKAPAKPARDNSWKMGDMASFSFDREMERREGCHRRGSRPPTRTSS